MSKDRVLTAEFPGLIPLGIPGDDGWDIGAFSSGYRYLSTSVGITDQSFVFETTIDLGGYTRQDDLTVFFRNSFEQKAGLYQGRWVYGSASEVVPLRAYQNLIYESVIVSSVPLNDDNLFASIFSGPGFTQDGTLWPLLGIEPGTFNREHIIHGSGKIWGISSLFGADPLLVDGTILQPGDTGGSTLELIDEAIYSSLEPTAADTLYCYRVFSLPQSFESTYTRFDDLELPARRVIMSTVVDEEPQLEYMMRLKRSYELANQV